MATEHPFAVAETDRSVTGDFEDLLGERHYVIRNVDRMTPFFVSVVSHSNHWLFVSSNGGLTAGRVSADTALFPYVTVDKIHDSATNTGCRTLLRVTRSGATTEWQPFDPQRHPDAPIQRSLYKHVLGNSVCFEEVHQDLGLVFRYRWQFSDRFGFIRECWLENTSDRSVDVALLDGLRNILPAGTPRFAQTNTSNLVDAYKWTEVDPETGLACFTLYSAITDRAEPAESLRANTVFSIGLDDATLLLGDTQLDAFRSGHGLAPERHTRGVRGDYLAATSLTLAPGETRRWYFVCDVEQDQADVVALRRRLSDTAAIERALAEDVVTGNDSLARLMANADALQAAAEEPVAIHHYANVLFNVLRGGIFDHHYDVSTRDFRRSLKGFDRALVAKHADWLKSLPETLSISDLTEAAIERGDAQLERLTREYLPIRFGRRHGDPSRPWNQFAIELEDDHGERLLAYQGNWRDIFQNWEALALSYPDFVENMIAKFVNASTVDGYNPYRITNEGIDWEVEEPDDPWSYIGYWGDHQIIYLQKLLELSQQFHPERLADLLHRPVFCYANVPYRIRPFAALLDDPKNTVDYDEALAEVLEQRVAARGADGKLVLDRDDAVYRVTLIEKLLVPLLAKLGNLVPDGGIWMNTQRPEWNDANNALVGNGASMVTLYYLRRYVTFLRDLFAETTSFTVSSEIDVWLEQTADALAGARSLMTGTPVSPEDRFLVLRRLGEASSQCRETLYAQGQFSGQVTRQIDTVNQLLDDALTTIDHSITTNRRDDGMYHAYNILDIRDGQVGVSHLYPMLEGQVAALSAEALTPEDSVSVLDALFASSVYRADQDSFLLYPDRALPDFLDRNRVTPEQVASIPLVDQMVNAGDLRLMDRDLDGNYRFHADLINAGELDARLDELTSEYGDLVESAHTPIHDIYEAVFEHREFTGRSGTMFGFEGLGSIYWHMVAKLLLAVQERFFAAIDDDADPAAQAELARHYYRVREGIGFNKTPAEYGAFPTDPYSHTPGHSGASQPGMTGQVKEEILTRFGELGLRIRDGRARFQPALLRPHEFLGHSGEFRFLDVHDHWQKIARPSQSLAYTWCQVPVIYVIDDTQASGVTLTLADDRTRTIDGLELSRRETQAITAREGTIRKVTVRLPGSALHHA
ncbi:MAG: hypothetical protein AAF545_10240 [Pseudomonadota bacterium]